jgi:hypothetical protein
MTEDKDGNHILSADRDYDITEAGSHRATMRGYAFGDLVEPGELVPAGVPVSTEWMEPVKGSKELARAVEQALDPTPDDVDLNTLKGAALKAYAATLNITPGNLSDAELRVAITAKRQPAA